MKCEYIVCPTVGDGNPAAALAALHFAEANGERAVVPVWLRASAWPASVFHRRMTADPAAAAAYAASSETNRLGWKARLFGKLSFAELGVQLTLPGRSGAGTGAVPDARLHVTQEHVLLAATAEKLGRLGVRTVRILVPDVYPKESAVRAAHRLNDNGLPVTFAVWNRAAESDLRQRSFPTTLVRPFLRIGVVGERAASAAGERVVAKSSGSGMPAVWRRSIVHALQQLDPSDSYYTQFHASHTLRHLNARRTQIRDFYGHTGTATEYIIGYPSELMMLVAELQLDPHGKPTQLWSLPPRGAHELRNHQFGCEHGLVAGDISFKDGTAYATPAGAQTAVPLAEVLERTPQRSDTIGGQLGTAPLFPATA